MPLQKEEINPDPLLPVHMKNFLSNSTPIKMTICFMLRLWTDRSLHITVHSQDLDKQAIYLSLGQHWSELSGQTIANVHSFWETFSLVWHPFSLLVM
jgi:hypothetical protein